MRIKDLLLEAEATKKKRAKRGTSKAFKAAVKAGTKQPTKHTKIRGSSTTSRSQLEPAPKESKSEKQVNPVNDNGLSNTMESAFKMIDDFDDALISIEATPKGKPGNYFGLTFEGEIETNGDSPDEVYADSKSNIQKCNGLLLKVRKLFDKFSDQVVINYQPFSSNDESFESAKLTGSLKCFLSITVKPKFRNN